MSDTRLNRMRTCLTETFAPVECQLEDESSLHVGHEGAASGGGHYRLRIVSPKFEGHNRIARHRLVYDSLGDMMRAEIHALTITALTPAEAQQ